ncbi:MAG: beta-lactamase class [Mycobacterium sp.]|nr:beta-lactamase class [Mycobacterium sp.]
MVAAAWAAGCSSRSPAPGAPVSSSRVGDPAEPLPPIEQRIAALEQRHNARVGLFAADLGSARKVEYHADDMFAMCSTFKVYAASAVLRRCEREELRLSDAVFVNPVEVKPNSPITQPQAGHTMSLGELCAAALQHSDNTAGNLLLSTLGGPQEIGAFARSIGDDKTRLDRWEIELNTAIPGDPRDTSTPRALGLGFQALLTGTALSAASRQQLDDWMRANVTSSMRAGLGGSWTTADKTGSGDYGSTNDVGIAYGPDGRKLLLAFMTRSAADDLKAEALRPLIGELVPQVLMTLNSA